MAQVYICTPYLGRGFITDEDTNDLGLLFDCYPAEVWLVKGSKSNINTWLKRNNLSDITKVKAQSIIDESFVSLNEALVGVENAPLHEHKLP